MPYQINENAIQNIINKLNANSFSDLAKYAKEEHKHAFGVSIAAKALYF